MELKVVEPPKQEMAKRIKIENPQNYLMMLAQESLRQP
jgi:RNA polymerase subunit RPABC4/transcription elongation factor Spt4